MLLIGLPLGRFALVKLVILSLSVTGGPWPDKHAKTSFHPHSGQILANRTGLDRPLALCVGEDKTIGFRLNSYTVASQHLVHLRPVPGGLYLRQNVIPLRQNKRLKGLLARMRLHGRCLLADFRLLRIIHLDTVINLQPKFLFHGAAGLGEFMKIIVQGRGHREFFRMNQVVGHM